ncbi:MAG: sigma-70 family RNA polymerase sigma factor [candidate division Zixibacteria bacterium]|nr:sigma-70 family RNA polymerase sigma factor [candidate division Zixibacteria bacterium]
MKADQDKELIRRVIQGDKNAFNLIVNKYKDKVFKTAMRMVRNKDDAYDITQEVFIRAYKGLKNFKGDSNLYTWLYRITVNNCLNFTSRDKFKTMASVADLTTPPVSSLTPESQLKESQLFEMLDEAIEQLPPQQRAVFIMRYYDEMTHAEIAKILNRSEGAIKANYFQAVKKLKTALKDVLGFQSKSGIVDGA